MPASFRVRILRRGQRDLIEIRRYLDREAPEASDDLLEQILSKIERLSRFPRMGPVPRDARLRRLGYRALSIADYLVFYKVRAREVRVLRVLHAKREYVGLL